MSAVEDNASHDCSQDILDRIIQSLEQPSSISDGTSFDGQVAHTFVILGATGHLAKRIIYPALWRLYRDNLLPKSTKFCGYSKLKCTKQYIREICEMCMRVKPGEQEQHEEFWQLNEYVVGTYNRIMGFKMLHLQMQLMENNSNANRIFYLSLPPTEYEAVTANIAEECLSENGWNRIVVEKPFGRDEVASNNLSDHLVSLFQEEQIYRIDHYLSREMVQKLMSIRFGNKILDASWNRESIASVLITFTEISGTRGGCYYFDDYGIIRDVMQRRLLQILSLVAMEKPVSCHPDKIRDAKVEVLKSVRSPTIEDMVLGQYVGNPKGEGEEQRGYLDSLIVKPGSKTPTFALGVFYINNERWEGVPFILRCGKALNEKKTEVSIQYQHVAGDLFEGYSKPNELIIQFQPDETFCLKMMTKSAGITFEIEEKHFDLMYDSQCPDSYLPDAYERLLLDVFCGSQMHFIRSDELKESWRILTPLLQQIDNAKIQPIPYVFGSRGPIEADQKLNESSFKYYGPYK